MSSTMDESNKSVNVRNCRICLNAKYSSSVTLNTDNWAQLYEFCFDLEVSAKDVCQIICQECADKVKEYADFKQQCYKSNRLWESFEMSDTKYIIEKPKIKHEGGNIEFPEDFNSDNDFQTDEKDIVDDNKTFEVEINKTDCSEVRTEVNATENVVHSDEINQKHIDNELFSEKLLILKTNNQDKDVVIGRKKVESKKPKPLKCSICDKVYKSKKWLEEHIMKSHTPNVKVKKEKPKKVEKPLPECPILFCGLCDFKSPDNHIVNQHQNIHAMNNDLDCRLCDYKGRDFADMVTHRYTHFPKDYTYLMICHACDKRHYSLLSLQYHYRSVHLNLTGGLCSVCNRTFKLFKSWKIHERRHKFPKFICDHCGKRFLFKHEIEQHVRIHSDKKEFMCDKCAIGFTRLYNLKDHIMVKHSIREPVLCTLCNKMFVCQKSYADHMKRIHDDKTLECNICFKRFSTVAVLNKHKFLHTDERPHVCEVCGSKFKLKSHFNVHMRRHTGNMPFKCELCTKCFTTIQQLRIHQSVHTGVRPFRCLFCDRTFNNRKLVLHHCRVRHVNENFIDEKPFTYTVRTKHSKSMNIAFLPT